MTEFSVVQIDDSLVVDQSATGDSTWPTRYVVRDEAGSVIGGVDARLVVGNDLDGTYPIGIEDREVRIHGGSTSSAIAVAVHTILTEAPRCRRVLLALPVGDLGSMRIAEEGGFRYVVDVDTHRASVSLLVAEPEWVLAQPSAMEDIPL